MLYQVKNPIQKLTTLSWVDPLTDSRATHSFNVVIEGSQLNIRSQWSFEVDSDFGV